MACKALDGQVARRQDQELSDLLDKFVCVRMVQLYGADLNLFQFDQNQTWTVFFMNADKTLYGRYGTRSEHDGMKEISLDGLKRTMEGALDLHKQYQGADAAGKKALKKGLDLKTGPKPPYPTPAANPIIAQKYNPLNPGAGAKVIRSACMWCHVNHSADLKASWASGKVSSALVWNYPPVTALGLYFDSRERATLKSVEPGSEAEKAGFKAGDKFVSVDGQPIISIADVQFVLQWAKEPCKVAAEVDRGGQKSTVTLDVPDGWRSRGHYEWKESIWSLRDITGFVGEHLAISEKKNLGVADTGMALRVKSFHGKQSAAQSAGLQPGDVIVEVDGQKSDWTEQDLFGHIFQKKRPNQAVGLTVLRGGQKKQVALAVR